MPCSLSVREIIYVIEKFRPIERTQQSLVSSLFLTNSINYNVPRKKSLVESTDAIASTPPLYSVKEAIFETNFFYANIRLNRL